MLSWKHYDFLDRREGTNTMISIVVIEYNAIDEIIQCVKEVKEYCKDVEYELIVSSNSCYSSERQAELRKTIPDVKWSFNEKNGGFAYGMNRGLKIAKGDYLVIMNPDVEVKGSLTVLIDFLNRHKKVGAIGPQIVGRDGAIQDSCRSFVTPWRFVKRQIRRTMTGAVSVHEGYDYSKTQTVDWVIGAFIMVRREVYEQVGGLDEAFFMYAEDIDWCTRIWQAGYEVVYCPGLKVVYEGSRSARKNKKYARIFLSSHVKYWRKNKWFFGYPKSVRKIY